MAEQNNLENIEKPQNEQVCSFFKKQIKDKNIRKRPVGQDEDDEESNGTTSVLSSGRKSSKADKLYFSTKRVAASDSVHESSDAIFKYESSKVIQVQTDNKATATLETETVFSRDARAIRERALKQAQEALAGKNKGSGDGTLYKDLNSYTDYSAGFRREQTIASEKAGGAHGPLRASAHIRVSTRFDYQPDICKDYKETGYCGYGDSCKFMHDRGDYKSGWQIEKEWEEAEKARKRNLAMGGGDDDEDGAEKAKMCGSDEVQTLLITKQRKPDLLPFACSICREPFVDAVVTKCKHYFCEHCALKHHTKNKKCFVCNQSTLGIFNTAHEIRKKDGRRQEEVKGFVLLVRN